MVNQYDLSNLDDIMRKAGWESIGNGMYAPNEELSQKIRTYRGSLESKNRAWALELEFLRR
jgi:hypothetical protein